MRGPFSSEAAPRAAGGASPVVVVEPRYRAAFPTDFWRDPIRHLQDHARPIGRPRLRERLGFKVIELPDVELDGERLSIVVKLVKADRLTRAVGPGQPER